MAANCLNAKESTGPKKPEGKNSSRWNAVEPELLSKRLVSIEPGKKAFLHMLTNLCEDYKPETNHEAMLAEQIAVGYCKVSLVHGCEAEFLGSGLGS